jgi:LacI family transcriptional regulator
LGTRRKESGDGRVTIRDVARASGVSVGTVSRALNGYPDVSEATRERIARFAREMDYTPAAAARTLVLERSHVIGAVLETGEGHPDLQHPFFHGVLVGLQERIGAAGYDLLLFASAGSGFGPDSYLRRCHHHSTDGVVLMGEPDPAEVERLMRSRIPCVGVDLVLDGGNASQVISDNVAGAAMAVAHLAELGHRRVATITGLLETRPARDRLTGYRQELQRRGLPYRDDYVVYGDYYPDSGTEAIASLLALEEPPTAVFCASDLMALGVLRGAAAAGVSVPEQLSVIGFDDIMVATHSDPPLTTLRQDKHGLGVATAEALLERIEGAEDATPARTLPVELIARGTCAPAAEPDR